MAGEIGVIARRIGLDRGGDVAAPGIERARRRRRHDQRPVLGADGVVGRHHADLRIARELGAVDIGETLGRTAEAQDLPLGDAGRAVVGDGGEAAQDRRHLGDRRRRRRQRRDGEEIAPAAGEPRLGEAHHLDHALIGLARIIAEGEDAVLQQDEAFDAGRLLVDLRRRFGQREARHDVGNEGHAPVIDLAAERLALRLVGQRQHRGRMRVIDEFLRQEGVQQRLDRGIGRGAVEEIGALRIHHVLVAEPLEPAQAPERREPHRRQAGRLDIAHVPARALDAEHLDLVAEKVAHRRLDRAVAAAMEDETGIAAQETGGVDAQRQIVRDALLAVALNEGVGVAVGPEAFHGAIPLIRRRAARAARGRATAAPRARRRRRRAR
jgi:hypothetical protein